MKNTEIILSLRIGFIKNTVHQKFFSEHSLILYVHTYICTFDILQYHLKIHIFIRANSYVWFNLNSITVTLISEIHVNQIKSFHLLSFTNILIHIRL